MLRNLEIIERLALYDENHEMFLKHDIKGNQFDTLSSRFYGTASLGVVGDQAWKWNSPALGYFRECEKEVLESFKNCCKHGNLGVLWEFYLYERLCNNSVQRVVTYNVLADQLIHSYDKKLGTPDTNMVNAEWFLDANFEKLFKNKAKLAFNFDLVQIQIPEYFTKKLFNFDLIGPQKDIHLLRVNCLLNRSLVKLALGKHTELEKETLWSIRAEIDLIKKDNLRSFEDYYVYRRVNNPVARPETLKDKKIYGELTISHQMKTIRLGVEALYEFVRVCYTFSTPIPEPDLLDVATLAGQKLQELKETIAASIKSMILADLPGYDEESHFRVMHLMRVLLNIWSSYSRLSTDLKANSKKYAKSRPDTEKESISKCLTGYSTLKDSIKDLAKQIEDVLEIAVSVKSYTLKSDLLQETGIKWPRVIESALSKVTSTYSSMFQNSIIDIQTKMSMLRKSLN